MPKALTCAFKQTILFTIFTAEHIAAQKGQNIERLNATNCFATEKRFLLSCRERFVSATPITTNHCV